MSPEFRAFDWAVLIAYFAGVMVLGFVFYRRTRSTEGFTAGGRSLPGWVCGLSIFGTYLSSISYLALPGKSFSGNWNPFVFSLSIPLVAWIAVRYFVPYYRRSGEVSAYALLERRFGIWARVYASVFYLLTQIARIAVVLYLMALPMQVIFGWDIDTILIVTGICVTIYAFVGGIVAVIWADALQAIVLMVGAVVCLVVMLVKMPGGASTVFAAAGEDGKFSLGSLSPSLLESTFWVVLVYGIVINLQNFGIDQSYVQRYVASRSDAEARKSVWLGALLYVPVSAVFFLIGTSLWGFYGGNGGDGQGDLDAVRSVVARQQLIQQGADPGAADFVASQDALAATLNSADLGDRVFPHFIATQLPPGVTGLLIAAIFAAAMSTVSTSLNSSATLLMTDYYRRFIRPDATEKQSMGVLYAGTVAWGILGTGLALVLVRVTQHALDMWWTLSGVLGGGMTGLFLLGLVSRRAGNPAAVSGVIAGLTMILWLTLPEFDPDLQSLVHAYLIPVFGTATIMLVGSIVTAVMSSSTTDPDDAS